MKRTLFLLAVILVSLSSFSAAKSSSVVKDVFISHAVRKVAYAQSIIKFTDAQAKQLVAIEYQFLIDVQKAENCKWGNRQKRVDALKARKDENLQKILEREQYIKYDAIEREVVKKYPLRSEFQ